MVQGRESRRTVNDPRPDSRATGDLLILSISFSRIRHDHRRQISPTRRGYEIRMSRETFAACYNQEFRKNQRLLPSN